MNLRIDANAPGARGSDLGASQHGAARTGTLRGETVQVRGGTSELGSAAEEISLGASERVESKTHAQRNVKPGERTRIMNVTQIVEYLDKAHHDSTPEEMALLARRLLRSNQQDLSQLMRANQNFRAPTEQYLLLQYARQLAPGEGASPAMLERIEDALADLEAWFGKAIEVNLATIDQAAKYADTAQEVRNFQGSVHVVLGKPSLTQALQEVLQLAGRAGNKLETALVNLMEALGAWLSATTSATEKALLQTLITDLYHLKSIKTLLEDCRALVKRMKRQATGAKTEGAQGRRARGADDGEGEQGHADR